MDFLFGNGQLESQIYFKLLNRKSISNGDVFRNLKRRGGRIGRGKGIQIVDDRRSRSDKQLRRGEELGQRCHIDWRRNRERREWILWSSMDDHSLAELAKHLALLSDDFNLASDDLFLSSDLAALFMKFLADGNVFLVKILLVFNEFIVLAQDLGILLIQILRALAWEYKVIKLALLVDRESGLANVQNRQLTLLHDLSRLVGDQLMSFIEAGVVSVQRSLILECDITVVAPEDGRGRVESLGHVCWLLMASS